MPDRSAVADRLRASILAHGAVVSIQTSVLTTRRDGVQFHIVSSRLHHGDGETFDIDWREFLDVEEAKLCARTRSKAVSKLIKIGRK